MCLINSKAYYMPSQRYPHFFPKWFNHTLRCGDDQLDRAVRNIYMLLKDNVIFAIFIHILFINNRMRYFSLDFVLPSESSFIKVHLMISDDISNPMTTPGRL
jgi:hypothetical protein